MSDLNKNFVIKNGLEVGLGGTVFKADTSNISLGNVGLGSTGGVVTVYGNLNVLGVTTVTVQGSVDAARTAERLLNARNISLSGVTTGSVSFDGSQNVTISQTLQPDAVGLGTHTSGEYVKNLTAGSGVSISSGTGEGSSPTITNSDRGSSQAIFKKIGIQTTSSATGIGTTISATSNTDEVQFIAGSNVTLTPDFSNKKITIGSTYIDTNTTYTIGVTDSSGDKLITLTPNSGAGTTVTLSAGSNVALNIVSGKLVISSTDTNTTYSVGIATSGFRLSGSDGSVGIITFRGSNGVGIATSSTGVTVSIASTIGIATVGYSTITASNIGIATIGRLVVSTASTFTGFSTFNGSAQFLTNTGYIQFDNINSRLFFGDNQSLTFGNGTNVSMSWNGTSANLLVGGPFLIRNNSVSGITSIAGNTIGTIIDFTQSGEVRIPGRLQIGTGGTVFSTTTSGSVGVGTTIPIGKLQVGTGSSSFIVTADGSVGIGTTNPTTALYVKGTLTADGIINTNTDFYRNGSSLTSQIIGLVVALS